MVSVTATQPCHSSGKAARQYANKWVWLCSNKTLFTKTGSRPNLASELWFGNPCQDPSLKKKSRASLVAQWLRISLPMQGTRVQALVREDPTCRRATKPVHHNYWARMPQLPKPVCLEPVLRNKRSHHNEKPAHRNEE